MNAGVVGTRIDRVGAVMEGNAAAVAVDIESIRTGVVGVMVSRMVVVMGTHRVGVEEEAGRHQWVSPRAYL